MRGPGGCWRCSSPAGSSRRRSAPPAFDPVVFEEVAAARGVALRDRLGADRAQAPARDHGGGRGPPRLRRRRLARRLRRQRRADAGRGEDGARSTGTASSATTGAAASPTSPRRRAWRAAATTSGWPPATTTTTGTPTSSWPACAGTRSSATNGDGTFADVTEAAGLARPDPKHGTLWAVAAAFVDYDRDGRLDLFVSNYCVWDPATEAALRRPEGARLLPPAPVRGAAELALPQQRRRDLRRRVRRRRGSAPTSARAWGSAWPTSTTTGGRTSSWPTTPPPRSCS